MEVQLCKTNYCFDWAVGLWRPAVRSRCNLNRSLINIIITVKKNHVFLYGPSKNKNIFAQSQVQQSHPDMCQTALFITKACGSLLTAPKTKVFLPPRTPPPYLLSDILPSYHKGSSYQQHQVEQVFRAGQWSQPTIPPLDKCWATDWFIINRLLLIIKNVWG